MGRKRKKQSCSQDSRTYQFRPRNGLGVFFSKKDSSNTSSIFQYNHRCVSPDSSFDNDEDIVEGILFTSFKELRGLENHSPLLIHSESSDEDYIDDNDLYQDSSTLFEKISLKMLDSHFSLKKFGKSGQGFKKDPRFYAKRTTKHLSSSNYNNRRCINRNTKFSKVLGVSSDITDRNNSKSNEFNFVEVVENISNNQHERLPSKNLLDASSHPFLIKNLLKSKYTDQDESLTRTFLSHLPIASTSSNCNKSEVKLPTVEANNEITYISSGINTHKYHQAPSNPLFSNSKKKKQFSIFSGKNKFLSSSDQYFDSVPILTSHSPILSPTILNHFEPVSFQHKTTTDDVTANNQLSANTCAPHTYLPITRNLHFNDTYFSRISGNSLVLSQQKYYRICMNHAYIAWSIFARETHLREEDSREKGLYPLILHNKKCHNKPILRPKVIREFEGSRYKFKKDSFYGKDLSIETFSPFHLPYQCTRREIGSTFQPCFSYCLTKQKSNEIPLPILPNTIKNRSYTHPPNLSLYPSTIYNNLNYFQRNPYVDNTLACSEPLSINNYPNTFSTCAESTQYSQSLKNLEFSSRMPVDLTKIFNPLLISDNVADPMNKNSHTKSNLPLYSHHTLQEYSCNYS